MTLQVTHYADPACPFDFSAEPVRYALRWHYGDGLAWRTAMIVLTLEEGEAEKLAGGAPNLQARFGMPIDPAPRSRPASSEPACRAVVAARLHAPLAEEPLLRRLRVRGMAGALLDDPALLEAAAADVGIDAGELARWSAGDDVARALAADIHAARRPAAAARALGHRLGGPAGERRYTAPSYELTPRGGGPMVTVPGFNPIEAYEVAIANLAPQLERRPAPLDPLEVLHWAGEPLATAEVAAVMGIGIEAARRLLAPVARPLAAGADCYWSAA